MGILMSKLFDLFISFKDDPVRILMVGLDAAGKTTILYKVKLNENVCTIPTIGFNVESVRPCPGISFTVWDVGGQTKLRPLWRHYYQNSQGLFYVVDSSDHERLAESRDELMNVIDNDEMRGVPVVVIANKQDLPGAMSTSEVADGLGLTKTRDRKWHIQGACALNGEGIYESMSEMARLVKEFKRQNRTF